MSTKKYLIIGAIILLLLISKRVSAEKLIAKFEGLRLKAYQDSGGIWTIGDGMVAAGGLGLLQATNVLGAIDQAMEIPVSVMAGDDLSVIAGYSQDNLSVIAGMDEEY